MEVINALGRRKTAVARDNHEAQKPTVLNLDTLK